MQPGDHHHSSKWFALLLVARPSAAVNEPKKKKKKNPEEDDDGGNRPKTGIYISRHPYAVLEAVNSGKPPPLETDSERAQGLIRTDRLIKKTKQQNQQPTATDEEEEEGQEEDEKNLARPWLTGDTERPTFLSVSTETEGTTPSSMVMISHTRAIEIAREIEKKTKSPQEIAELIKKVQRQIRLEHPIVAKIESVIQPVMAAQPTEKNKRMPRKHFTTTWLAKARLTLTIL